MYSASSNYFVQEVEFEYERVNLNNKKNKQPKKKAEKVSLQFAWGDLSDKNTILKVLHFLSSAYVDSIIIYIGM